MSFPRSASYVTPRWLVGLHEAKSHSRWHLNDTNVIFIVARKQSSIKKKASYLSRREAVSPASEMKLFQFQASSDSMLRRYLLSLSFLLSLLLSKRLQCVSHVDTGILIAVLATEKTAVLSLEGPGLHYCSWQTFYVILFPPKSNIINKQKVPLSRLCVKRQCEKHCVAGVWQYEMNNKSSIALV